MLDAQDPTLLSLQQGQHWPPTLPAHTQASHSTPTLLTWNCMVTHPFRSQELFYIPICSCRLFNRISALVSNTQLSTSEVWKGARIQGQTRKSEKFNSKLNKQVRCLMASRKATLAAPEHHSYARGSQAAMLCKGGLLIEANFRVAHCDRVC